MPPKKYIPVLLGALLVFILILVLAFRLGGREKEEVPEAQAEIQAGLDFLSQLEAQDPAQVEQKRKQIQQQKIQELRDERLRQLESGEISVWSLFEDYVLLGDSRAVGFYFYGYLPQERVLAEAGATIRSLKEHIPDIVALNPSNLFFCYGLNDVSIGIWPTPEDYVEEFADTIAEIQSELPDVKIFVSSILPAKDPAFNQSSAWRNIPQYSAAVEEMCKTIDNCYYVNNDATAAQYTDLWEPDGIHVGRDFYPHWAANLITEVYGSTLGDGSDDNADA